METGRKDLPVDRPPSQEAKHVLIVDDEENMRHMLSLLLAREGYRVSLAQNGVEGLEVLSKDPADIVLCDLKMPVMDGMEFLEECKSRELHPTIIMMSAYGTLDTAVEAMKRGAYDYVQKPFRPDEVILTLRKAEERERLRRENLALREELARLSRYDDMVGRSRAMQEIFSTIEKVAPYSVTVLILGESGVGKELIARAIHRKSPRANGPFLALNCGAVPPSLMESELFGHVRGAFTDATHDKKGLFQMAHQGTLLLDEIGELPKDLQVKLLRVLQDQEVRPVGGTKSQKVDVRILAATSKDLEEEVRGGRFREDLFYRLNVVTIQVPPLRQRQEDIPLLVDHFLARFRKRLGVYVEGVSPRAMAALMRYPWPGNVRELENVIERACVLCDGKRIEIYDLPERLRALSAVRQAEAKEDLRLRPRLRSLERELVEEALRRSNGNRTQAARLLGITHRALMYKLRAMGKGEGLGETSDGAPNGQ
jgi:two-component system response regulator AtoC